MIEEIGDNSSKRNQIGNFALPTARLKYAKKLTSDEACFAFLRSVPLNRNQYTKYSDVRHGACCQQLANTWQRVLSEKADIGLTFDLGKMEDSIKTGCC